MVIEICVKYPGRSTRKTGADLYYMYLTSHRSAYIYLLAKAVSSGLVAAFACPHVPHYEQVISLSFCRM